MQNGLQISELAVAYDLKGGDLLVLQRDGTAMQVPESTLIKALTAAADGHGGIQRIAKSGASGLTDTYTITYADGTTGSFSVKNGAAGPKGDKGDPGEKGADGDSAVLTGQTVHYGISSSGTATPTIWYPAPQQAAAGMYLWTRVRLTFSGGETTFYTVSRQGADGAGGSGGGSVSSVNGIGPDDIGNVTLDAADISYSDSTVAAALGECQPKITATGLLKRESDGNIIAAEAGIDYAAVPVARTVTLSPSARKDQYSGTQKTWTSTWTVTGLPVTTASQVIVAPGPGDEAVWSRASIRASDVTTNGTMMFACDYDNRPSADVTARILVL